MEEETMGKLVQEASELLDKKRHEIVVRKVVYLLEKVEIHQAEIVEYKKEIERLESGKYVPSDFVEMESRGCGSRGY